MTITQSWLVVLSRRDHYIYPSAGEEMEKYMPDFQRGAVPPLVEYKTEQFGAEFELDMAGQQRVNLTSRPKRGQANRRERVRTENVNAGFERLRKLIPTEPENRKLSKIEILRLSASYIQHLYNLSRANSCLEAYELDLKGATQEANRHSGSASKSKNHVCTFCLMRTKPVGTRKSG